MCEYILGKAKETIYKRNFIQGGIKMLKSTFKKVSAIAIAGTMLAGMMAVPANAMTEVMED